MMPAGGKTLVDLLLHVHSPPLAARRARGAGKTHAATPGATPSTDGNRRGAIDLHRNYAILAGDAGNIGWCRRSELNTRPHPYQLRAPAAPMVPFKYFHVPASA